MAVFDAFRDADWIGNSRNRADETVVRIIASMAGFEARLTQRAGTPKLQAVDHRGTASRRASPAAGARL